LREFFISAVGTGIGKTLVTAILCQQLTRQGFSVAALKPVVSGFIADDPASDPALILRSLGRAATSEAIAAIAPWRFRLALSPHLAAQKEGRLLALEEIVGFCREHKRDSADFLFIEGAGGVMTPLNDAQTCLDLVVRLGCAAILVTGTYLGALSHTFTGLRALSNAGVTVGGIVVSESVESAGLAETVESLRCFAGAELPLYALPRFPGRDEQKWRAAPSLTGLCGVGDFR
jgi:dethiobiotin synthetase